MHDFTLSDEDLDGAPPPPPARAVASSVCQMAGCEAAVVVQMPMARALLTDDGWAFCDQHRVLGRFYVKNGFTTQQIARWPFCEWCHARLSVGEYRQLLDGGYVPGEDDDVPVWCETHAIIAEHNPRQMLRDGIAGARALDALPEERLIRLPFPSLHRMAGPMVPGRVYLFCAFSGGGKTSFATNVIWEWIQRGVKVSYVPTEASVAEVVTRFACFLASVSPDDALSFRLRDRALRGDAEAIVRREELQLAWHYLERDERFQSCLRIAPLEVITVSSFQRAIKATKAMGSHVLFVDHVDHIDVDADDFSPEIVISNRIQMMALQAAKTLDIPVVLMCQLNSRYANLTAQPLRRFRPPLPDWLYNKGKKEMIAAGMFGVHRVLDPHAPDDLLTRITRGDESDGWKATLPHVMGVSDMKARFGRGTKRGTILLDYTGGVLKDRPLDIFDAINDTLDDSELTPSSTPTPAPAAAPTGPRRSTSDESTAWIHD